MNERMTFEQVDFVFDALHNGFHPEGINEDEGPNDKMLAIWTLFLTCAGWTEDEYWAEIDKQPKHACPKCQSEQEEKAKTQVN